MFGAGGGSWAVASLAELRQYSTNLTLAKAETTKGAEDLGLRLDPLGLKSLTIGASVSMLKTKAGGDAACDDELTAVCRSMMSAAQRDQVVGVVRPALRAEADVMQVQR